MYINEIWRTDIINTVLLCIIVTQGGIEYKIDQHKKMIDSDKHIKLGCTCTKNWPEVIKKIMLNSAEHEIFPAHKC